MRRIKNITKNTVVSKNFVKAKGFRNKILGLMGDISNGSLFIETRFGLHTFGMKVPLDIVILNDEDKVVKIKEDLMPGKIFVWNPKYKKILELPQGSITKSKTIVGDKISF